MKDELDFIEALTKTAGLGEALTGKSPELLAALSGAGLVAGMQYLMSRQGTSGAPSAAQRSTRAALDAMESMKSRAKKDKRPLTFKEEISTASAPAAVGWADTFAKHPGRAALMAAPSGALAGLAILKALK